MRTDLFRAIGTDGRIHIVFRRIQTYAVRSPFGTITRQREPKFYLGNGDPLECGETYDTFRTPAGDLIVRLILPQADRHRWRGFDTHEREGKQQPARSRRKERVANKRVQP
jgi:hypothetical protein